MRRTLLVAAICSAAFGITFDSAIAGLDFTFQRTPESGAAGTVITVSADNCDQTFAGAGLVGNPGGVVPVQAETTSIVGGSWSVQLVLPAGIDPDLAYVVVASCGNPDAEGGFFYFPDLPFDVLPSSTGVATVGAFTG